MADGFQCTNNRMNDFHHTANVTYNVLRGGIFSDNYNIQKSGLLSFLKVRNKNIFETYDDDISKLPDTLSIKDLKEFSDRLDDPSFRRICREYLPLTLGRRHGDPQQTMEPFLTSLQRTQMINQYFIMKATGEIFFRTGRHWV